MSDAKRSYHRFKLKMRRKVRKQKRQVENIAEQADSSIDNLVFARMNRLHKVRRFVLAWVILMLLIGFGSVWQVRGLDKFYLSSAPSEGGIYREGIIGSFTTASPLFAVSSADVSVSKLVFSGLFKLNPNGNLEPDLATKFETDENGYKYTVHLREDVKWHDGENFNSEDVVFTYLSIKNPNVKSPLFTSWRDVGVEATDQYTVVFTLPNTLSSFKYSLINGIVPEHILKDEEAENLRTAKFNNINPVGTGMFEYKSVEVLGIGLDDRQEKVSLVTNEDYYSNRANINGVVFRTYREEDLMIDAFENGEISSMVGLQTVAEDVVNDESVTSYSTPLSSTVMLFLNNSSDILADKAIRKALLQATDTDALRKRLGYQLINANSPFLKSHFAYDANKVQDSYDIKNAEKILNDAGWAKDLSGKRSKDGKPLKFSLVSQSLTEYASIVQGLQEQWDALGITVEALLQPEIDIQSGAISRHDYDILLYGISIGPDPDVYAFWHSTQADERLKTRLNLSEYKNEIADKSLEAGRTRLDEDLRKIKYQSFLDEWKKDSPAIALYQPRFLFVARSVIEGYSSGQFNDPTDRFYSINDWTVRREKTIK